MQGVVRTAISYLGVRPKHRLSIRLLPAILGAFVLLGLALGYAVSPYWYLLTGFAGLNMVQASITGFCPAALIFKKLGLRDGCAFS